MAARLQAKVVATTTTVTEVRLSPKARQMVKVRCEEHANLAGVVKSGKSRMKRIETEVDELFTKERAGKALLDGTSLDGHRLKMVLGKHKVFDQMGFMKKHGVTQEDFDEFTTEEDNTPYIRMTGPKEKEDE